MFLSSISQRCFGLSHQISRCTFQRDKVEFTRLAHLLAKFSLFQQDPICLGLSMKVSCKQICIVLPHLSSESDSVFRLTPVCLGSFFRGVLTVFVFALHPESLMMSGACLKSSSMSKFQFAQLRLQTYGSTTEGFSHLNLRIQVFPCLSLCIRFEKTVDVFESIII